MTKTFTKIVLATGALLIVFIFQNCGEIKVQQASIAAPVFPQSKPGGYFCSDAGPNYTTPLKVLFVVDMSLSNLGGELVYMSAPSGTDTYKHTLGTFYKEAVLSGGTLPDFDLKAAAFPFATPTEKANSIVVSDKDGNRFQALRNFIDPTSLCSQIGSNFTYSAIGFADNFMIPKDEVQTCESDFVKADAFSRQIDGLKKYQDLDLNPMQKTRATGPESPYQMGDTNYRKGLMCMETKVRRDALYDAENLPFYYIIFLSDGMATDRFDPCAAMYSYEPKFQACIQENKVADCYNTTNAVPVPDYACLNKVVIPGMLENLKRQVAPIAAGFKFQPVFYWPSGQSGGDYDKALQVMQPLAQIGGVPGVLKLEGAQSMLDLQKTVCSTIDSSMKVDYSIQSYMAVNLTARMKKGVLKADSDADGLTDEEEPATATDSRALSNGKVLDSVCRIIGPAACAAVPACDVNKISGIGLNECDQMALETYSGLKIDAVDSDSDGLLDLVELIKGSNLVLNDANSTTSTGDRKLASQVVAAGFDLQADNSKYPPQAVDLMQAQFNFQRDAAECGENKEQMSVYLENIPLVPVAAYNDGRQGPLSLSHGKDENVVLLTYRVSPVGGLPSDERVYAMILHVDLNGKAKEPILPSSFVQFKGAMP